MSAKLYFCKRWKPSHQKYGREGRNIGQEERENDSLRIQSITELVNTCVYLFWWEDSFPGKPSFGHDHLEPSTADINRTWAMYQHGSTHQLQKFLQVLLSIQNLSLLRPYLWVSFLLFSGCGVVVIISNVWLWGFLITNDKHYAFRQILTLGGLSLLRICFWKCVTEHFQSFSKLLNFVLKELQYFWFLRCIKQPKIFIIYSYNTFQNAFVGKWFWPSLGKMLWYWCEGTGWVWVFFLWKMLFK